MSLRVQIDSKLEHKFRETAMKRFGYGKGALGKAAAEAIMVWISTVEKEKLCFEGEPGEAIDGLLSEIDLDSVSLQHETKKLWTQEVVKARAAFKGRKTRQCP